MLSLMTIFLVALLSVPQASAQEGVQPGTDAAAALALAQSIDNLPAYLAAGGLPRGWNSSSGVPLCQWSGITCTGQGQIQSLTLQCPSCPVRASGTLPAALANLTAATTLNLGGNSFKGTLPPEWGAAGALPALQNLMLNNNELTGSIPDSWGSPGAFPQLSLLRIDTNRLSGALPATWGQQGSGQGASTSLPNLLVLRLLNNRLAGPLPGTWGTAGAFPRLQTLALQNNTLTGSVPATWQEPGAMRALQELTLQSNRLSGQLPSSWGGPDSWPALRVLNLDDNPLGGTLPMDWGLLGGWPALRTLGLNSTQITGSLPPEWGSNTSFRAADVFWLQRNELTGAIPASWAQLTSLKRLVVRPGNPQLCGPVPPGLPFLLCTDADVSCVRVQVRLTEQECQLADQPGAETPAGGTARDGSPPASTTDGRDGGGGVSAAAIAAPVAVGVALLLAAVGGGFFVAGRRRRRRRQEEEKQAAAHPPHQLGAHPFDTEEGQAALTSPFAAGTFQTSSSRSEGSTAQQQTAAGAAAAGGGGRTRSGAAPSPASSAAERRWRQRANPSRGTHDSAGTRSDSTLSGASMRSFLAQKCARIETKSGNLGVLHSPAGSGELVAAAEGGAPAPARSTSAPAAPGVGVAERAGSPAGPAGVGGAVEMQPLRPRQLTAEEAAALAEGGDKLGGGPLLPLQPVQRISSEEHGSSSDSLSGLAGTAFGDLPFSDWQISPAEVTIVKRPDGSDWSLGSGGFGKVYKGLRHGVQPVAVKVLAVGLDMRQMALAEFRREVAILRACRDVNIVQFIGAHLGPDQTMLVTEYLEGGDLMRNISAGRVSWYRRGKKIALDVARGLVFLHSKRVVHLDIKSPNVLLARDGTAKVADVGMARILARDYVTGVVGTLAWAAPELLWGERCTEKADIYSFGILLWEICSGEKPVRGQLRDLRVPQECPASVRDLILQCLETRPSRRPSALEMVQRLAALPGDGGPAQATRATPTPAAAHRTSADEPRSSSSAAAAAAAAAGVASVGSAPAGVGGTGGSSGRQSSEAASGQRSGGSEAAPRRQRVALGPRSASDGLGMAPTVAARLQQHLLHWRADHSGGPDQSAAAVPAPPPAGEQSQQPPQPQQQQPGPVPRISSDASAAVRRSV